MANKNLENLLQKLQSLSAEQKGDIEPLSDSEAEEIAGGNAIGADINLGCPQNTGCGPNSGCHPTPVDAA